MRTWTQLAKEISDAIFEAVESKYYCDEDDFKYPNYMEIREWVDLEYIDPENLADDEIIDNYIKQTLEAIWPIVNTFGAGQEM